MKANSSDIRSMSFKDEYRIRIVALAGVELDLVCASSRNVGLVWRDAEAVYLRLGVGYLAAAEARECFPKAAQDGTWSVFDCSRGEKLQVKHRTEWCGHSRL